MNFTDIHQEVDLFRNTPGALLLDVRTPEEFAEGRIPGSVNIPLQELPTQVGLPVDKSTPIFAYCRSGGRSNRAVAFLQKIGYTGARNIGGIMSWTGEIEK